MIKHLSSLSGLCALVLIVGAAQAARADADEPLTIDAGQMRIDGKRGTRLLTGAVEITRGSLSLRADEVEMHEGPQGQLATAKGSARKPATFRQRRLADNEVVEGQSQRIEYDAASEVVKLVGAAQVKVFRGSVVVDQVSGSVITYDHRRDVVEVAGGASAAPGAASAAAGRVRAIVTPRHKNAPNALPEEGAPQ
jgi:lipopolysaccharide export system protein LptA